jgi:hypothetical protein
MNVLKQILLRQQNKAGQNGKEIKLKVRRDLEGWDLFDLVTDRDPRPGLQLSMSWDGDG